MSPGWAGGAGAPRAVRDAGIVVPCHIAVDASGVVVAPAPGSWRDWLQNRACDGIPGRLRPSRNATVVRQRLGITMEAPSFFTRIGMAFRLLFDGAFANAVVGLGDGSPRAVGPAPTSDPSTPPITQSEPDQAAALQLLAILQREGRLLDFLREDVSGYQDAEIGAAARVVHEGCARALERHVELTAIRQEGEGDRIELAAGFDAARIRLTGNVVGDPPFRGTLAHHGWEVTALRLPSLAAGHDPAVVAPAEVEL